MNCSGLTTDAAHNDKAWGVYENRLVTFSNNTLTNVYTLAYLGASLIDSTISNNIVTNTTGSTGSSTASFLCNSNFSNVTISGNTFDRTRSPEQSCTVSTGSRPKFQGNVYTATESRDQQGTTHITTSQTLIRPQFEEAIVITDAPNMIAKIDTALYVDGQTLRITGGSSGNPLRFATGQSSYYVAAERKLTGGSMKFTFSAAQKKWIEAQ